ncbi:MAG TPA: flagellar protein FlgN [Spirochaetota bacterium]|nr:flagellar protein FlgN [Spirochaetota bacterium]HPI91082.1 flagellar protein FlgN [Spirochaetota bacterium]HPR47741.1 flagellar protein FlgN [Spirochaetota bacterium]
MVRTTEIIPILRKEILLYTSMLDLEIRKTDVISERQGSELDRICSDQEAIISELVIYEKARLEEIRRIVPQTMRDSDTKTVTLKELAEVVDPLLGTEVLETGRELKKVVTAFSRIQKMNQVILEDNLEFFSISLKGMKSQNTLHSGYDRQGREKGTIAGSILFNQTA